MSGSFRLVNFAKILVFDVNVKLVVDVRYLDQLGKTNCVLER